MKHNDDKSNKEGGKSSKEESWFWAFSSILSKLIAIKWVIIGTNSSSSTLHFHFWTTSTCISKSICIAIICLECISGVQTLSFLSAYFLAWRVGAHILSTVCWLAVPALYSRCPFSLTRISCTKTNSNAIWHETHPCWTSVLINISSALENIKGHLGSHVAIRSANHTWISIDINKFICVAVSACWLSTTTNLNFRW